MHYKVEDLLHGFELVILLEVDHSYRLFTIDDSFLGQR